MGNGSLALAVAYPASLRRALDGVLLLLLVTFLASAAASSPKKRSPPAMLEFYLHNYFNVTSHTILPPVTSTSQAGLMNIYNDVITEKPAASSKKVGTFSGFEVETGSGQPYSSLLVLSSIEYNDGGSKGTLVVHDRANYTAKTTTVAILGGTEDFLGVYGFGIRRLYSLTMEGNISYAIGQWNVYLSYR